MDNHPIPQDITGYRFHIIGSMTLKQFVEISIGVVIGGIIYSTNLPAVIKFPLILFSVALGGMAAFLPIEDRPLDHWIITFFRVMYNPTQFFWRREPNIPDCFNFTPNAQTMIHEPEIDLGPAKKQRIREYMTSVPNTVDPFALDASENSRISSIMSSFSSTEVTSVQVTPTKLPQHISEKPQLGVRVRSLRAKAKENVVFIAEDVEMTTTHVPAGPRIIEETVNGVETNLATQYLEREQLTKQSQNVSEVAGNIAIPALEEIHVVPQAEDGTVAPAIDTTTQQMIFDNSQGMAISEGIASEEAGFNTSLPFPEPPSEPNKLVGMVLSPTNELIVNAIVEIQTPTGAVARAVKTNTLGQFFITTPLEDGAYNLVVEKDGYKFSNQHIQIN